MVAFSTWRVLPYPRERIFDLVADVERYPDFLPTWQEATVYRRAGPVYYTEQVIDFGLMRERFRSKTILGRPDDIRVMSSSSTFRKLTIHWEFEPTPEGGCRVQLSQVCNMRLLPLDVLLQGIVPRIADHTIGAFENRAHRLCAPSR